MGVPKRQMGVPKRQMGVPKRLQKVPRPYIIKAMVERVLVVYKKSAYELSGFRRRRRPVLKRFRRGYHSADELKRAHAAHYGTLEEVQKCLRRQGVSYALMQRGRPFREKDFDLILTVGGDGTFLETAHRVRRQVMVGVNSMPGRSVGKLCLVHKGNLAALTSSLQGKIPIKKLNRIQPRLNGHLVDDHVLNDVLISHPNPAAMTHYWIRIGSRREEHRGSGLWISTAAGSTGAIQSAGGVTLPLESRKIQYRPRELYILPGLRYRLRGGVLASASLLKLGCLSEEARVYIDGERSHLNFYYGDRLEFVESPHPLRTIV